MSRSTLLRMSRHGNLTLPKEVRAGFDESTVFEATRRDDGVIELRPHRLAPQSQAWFWTERWQKMEMEADEAIEAGRVRRHDTGDEFISHLEQVAAEEHSDWPASSE